MTKLEALIWYGWISGTMALTDKELDEDPESRQAYETTVVQCLANGRASRGSIVHARERLCIRRWID